jgi:hypothetical protein
MPAIVGWGKVVALEVQPEASHKYGEFGVTVTRACAILGAWAFASSLRSLG